MILEQSVIFHSHFKKMMWRSDLLLDSAGHISCWHLATHIWVSRALPRVISSGRSTLHDQAEQPDKTLVLVFNQTSPSTSQYVYTLYWGSKEGKALAQIWQVSVVVSLPLVPLPQISAASSSFIIGSLEPDKLLREGKPEVMQVYQQLTLSVCNQTVSNCLLIFLADASIKICQASKEHEWSYSNKSPRYGNWKDPVSPALHRSCSCTNNETISTVTVKRSKGSVILWLQYCCISGWR